MTDEHHMSFLPDANLERAEAESQALLENARRRLRMDQESIANTQLAVLQYEAEVARYSREIIRRRENNEHYHLCPSKSFTSVLLTKPRRFSGPYHCPECQIDVTIV